MAGSLVRVTGDREVVAALARLRHDVEDLREADQGIGQDIEAEARSRVRVSTGRLRSTIRRVDVKGKSVVVAGGPEAPYAGVINYHRPGDGFLTGAANSDTGSKVVRIERNLESLIRRTGLH